MINKAILSSKLSFTEVSLVMNSKPTVIRKIAKTFLGVSILALCPLPPFAILKSVGKVVNCKQLTEKSLASLKRFRTMLLKSQRPNMIRPYTIRTGNTIHPWNRKD